MSAIEVIYGESGFIRLNTPTVVGGALTAMGTNIDVTTAISATPAFIAPASATTTDTTYVETTVANGNKLAIEDKSKSYLVKDGTETPTGGTAAAYGSLECSGTLTYAQVTAIKTAFEAGSPIFAIGEFGKIPSTGAPAAFVHIFGHISAFTVAPAQGPSTYNWTITGSTFGSGEKYTLDAGFDYTDYNTACTGGSNTITPLNDGSARTISAIATGDFTDTIGKGKVLLKSA